MVSFYVRLCFTVWTIRGGICSKELLGPWATLQHFQLFSCFSAHFSGVKVFMEKACIDCSSSARQVFTILSEKNTKKKGWLSKQRKCDIPSRELFFIAKIHFNSNEVLEELLLNREVLSEWLENLLPDADHTWASQTQYNNQLTN